MKLERFVPDNGFWPGANTSQFLQLEYLMKMTNNSKDPYSVLPHMGFFGEASTGKTTTATALAKFMGYEVTLINASSLTKQNFMQTMAAIIEKPGEFRLITALNPPGWYSVSTKKRIVIIDEAHELPKNVQTMFLSCLDTTRENNIVSFPELSPSGKNLVVWPLCFIFITTDSSKLAYPLVTRLQPVIFDQYTEDDVANIIKLTNPKIDPGGRLILARCSKLVPRVALRYAKMLLTAHSSDSVIDETCVRSFITTVLGMEDNGIDAIDKRILLYLHRNKKQVAAVDEISLEAYQRRHAQLEQKATLTPAEHRELNAAKFKISMLTEKISSAEYTPKSREDISIACRILDLSDLEARLTYLEKLSMLTKTSRGIILNAEYLAKT